MNQIIKLRFFSILFFMGLIAMPLWAANKVATLSLAEGVVEIQAAETKIKKAAKVGDSVNENDTVITHENSKALVTLGDQTQLALSSNGALVVDKFVLGSGGNKGSVSASFTKGIFKYVSGSIAKDKGNVQIKVPHATITVRGTEFEGKIEEKGNLENNTIEVKASIVLISGEIIIKSGDSIIKMNTPGFGTDINGLGKISVPVLIRGCS